jgi:hypothetical protein
MCCRDAFTSWRCWRICVDSRISRTGLSRESIIWLCLALFVAAVLSKEITVTVPAGIAHTGCLPVARLPSAPVQWFGPAARRVWIEKVPIFAVGVTDGLMTLYISLSHRLADSIHTMGWIPRIKITIYGMAFYLAKTIAPLHLSALYPLTRYNTDAAAAPFLMSAAVVLAVSVVAVALRRCFPGLLAVWLVYAVTLLPVGGIFTIKTKSQPTAILIGPASAGPCLRAPR